MRRAHWWSLTGLLALIGLILTVAAEAQVVERPAKKEKVTLESRLAKETKLKKASVAKILKVLGPALREELKTKGQVEIAGLGTIRVVRITEYKDLVNGLPTTIPARNYIEFVGESVAETAVNQAGVPPARTVQGYEFRVNPGVAPGIRTEGRKVPRTRTR